jgi:putative transposase
VARSDREHHGSQRAFKDLVDRGLDLKRRYLVVMDGSKALRDGVQRVFGEQVEVQRCQIHKRRNVKEYLPENCQRDYDRRMRNAHAMSSYAEAKAALEKIFRQLERINPSAARSLILCLIRLEHVACELVVQTSTAVDPAP